MPLQLWIGHGGHFFVDTSLDIQVGQAFQERVDGPWTVEVNDSFLTVADLETAKRLFVEKYDRTQVQLSPASLDCVSADLSEGYNIVDLTPLQNSSG